MKIVEIDSKQFYGKELNEQNIVILFKRPLNDIDTVCESYCQDILNVIKQNSDNLFASDIIRHCQWNSDDRKIIERTLYVRVANKEDPITSDGILCERCGIYDVILFENKEVARIIAKKKTFPFFQYFLIFIFILCTWGVIKWCNGRFEENRDSANQNAYLSDIRAIDSLSYLFDESISSNNSYSPYIHEPFKIFIASQIDSLRNVANLSISRVKESGDYSPVVLDKESFKRNIQKLVENAKGAELASLERNRVDTNKKAYEKDVKTIMSLEEDLSNAISQVMYSNYVSDSQVKAVKLILDSLKNSSDVAYREVENSGYYTNIAIDSDNLKRRINKIVEFAQEEYKRKNRARPIHPSNNNLTSRQKRNSNEIARYNMLVESANRDYTKFYMNGDKAAARRAYNNYGEALQIKYDTNVNIRRNKLGRDLK